VDDWGFLVWLSQKHCDTVYFDRSFKQVWLTKETQTFHGLLVRSYEVRLQITLFRFHERGLKRRGYLKLVLLTGFNEWTMSDTEGTATLPSTPFGGVVVKFA
jgi:hypothetical protein